MRPGSDIPQGAYSFTWAHSRPYAGPRATLTHEQFCHRVRDLAVGRLTADHDRQRLLRAKLIYGVGAGYYRGICYFGAWKNGHETDLIEIAATGEESAVQLAGTTIHETGHVLAGPVGHGKEWKDACFVLGLRDVLAAGQVYSPETFAPDLWPAIQALGEPGDGNPQFGTGRGFVGLPPAVIRPCPMGRGARGGRMVQTSRLRLFHCGCNPPLKIRAARDESHARCNLCGQPYGRV